MADLIAYLFAERYFEASGGATQGAQTFEVKGCVSCHLANGKGIGPSLSKWRDQVTPVALATAMWNHGPVMLKRMREQQLPWPQLQAAEMMDLMEFLNQGAGVARTPTRRP